MISKEIIMSHILSNEPLTIECVDDLIDYDLIVPFNDHYGWLTFDYKYEFPISLMEEVKGHIKNHYTIRRKILKGYHGRNEIEMLEFTPQTRYKIRKILDDKSML